MKQTAVEWLWEQIENKQPNLSWYKIFEQAKEMEKQQIGYSEKQMDDSYDKGFKDAIEKMYSEEEVYQLLYDLSGQVLNNKVSNPKLLEKWFNKFKKK